MRNKDRILGKIGSCYNCSWREEDFKKDVLKLAREHAKKFKHKTNVEMVISYNYG